MSLLKCLILSLSIAIAQGADKKEARFAPGPASSYTNRQTNSGVIIAAVAYETDEQAKPAFGKLNPYKHGVLPVLVIIQNDSSQALRLEDLRVDYISPERRRIEATPAKDVAYLKGPGRPTLSPSPIPGRSGSRKPKNPLAAWEIEGRAFAAKMLPRGESAHGFFYFQTLHRGGSIIYISGIQEAGTGKDVFYFEIPLESPTSSAAGAASRSSSSRD